MCVPLCPVEGLFWICFRDDKLCPTAWFYRAKKSFYICIWLKNQKKTISWHIKIWNSMSVSISKVIWEHGGMPLSLGFRWLPSCYFWICVTESPCPAKAKIVTFWSSQESRPFHELFLHFKLSVASYLLLCGLQEMWKYEHCIIHSFSPYQRPQAWATLSRRRLSGTQGRVGGVGRDRK